MSLLVIYPPSYDPADMVRLDHILEDILSDIDHIFIRDMSSLKDLKGQRILFAVPLGRYGLNTAYTGLLYRLRSEPALLENSISAMIIDGDSELFTKSTATELAFAINFAGSALIGRSVVEGTGSLANLRVQAKLTGTDLSGAYRAAARELTERLLLTKPEQKDRPKLLALHASSHRTSNTMQLWNKVSEQLRDQLNNKNPIALANEAKNISTSYSIAPEFKLRYNLLGLEETKTRLSYEGNVVFNIFNQYSDQFMPLSLSTSGYNDSQNKQSNRTTANSSKSLGITTTHTLTFTPAFKNKDHVLTMMLRGQLNSSESSSQSTVTWGLPSG